MEVTESYRILELEIGASRAEVDAAYCRLVERYHPDRAASGGPEAVRDAQVKVQALNDAYQTLAKISPKSVGPLAAQNQEVQKLESDPSMPVNPAASSVAPAAVAKSKPKLPPLPIGQPTLGRSPPPPPPPPPDTWAARPAPVASTPASPISSPPPPPSRPTLSPPPSLPQPTPPPATSVPPPPPKPAPVISTPPPAAAQPASSSSSRSKRPSLLETLLPSHSPLRRFAPVILVAVLIFVVFLGKCAFSSRGNKSARELPPDPKTTGRLIVKSNRANATVEATRLATPGSATTASFDGSVDQALSGLPPGKYAVMARADGWPEIREEAVVEAEHTTELAMNFKSGSLRLDSDPEGATVRLGSTGLGRTPLVIPQLPPGECQLTLQYPFWPDLSFKASVTENMESSKTVRLPHGKLTVETARPGTTVQLAGRIVGQTPLTLERVPAGINKLILNAKGFPPLKLSVTVEDRGEAKIHPVLGAVFPVLDPAALLRAIWVRNDPDDLAPPLEGVTGPFQSRNGVVKNLNRKWLSEAWLGKWYCCTGIVKSYDRVSGQLEFNEQQSELSKYRVLALLSPEARNDPDLPAQLIKGASFSVYGRLSAVEEPRWPSKVITIEFSAADPLR